MRYILYIQIDTHSYITIFGREWVAVLKLKGLHQASPLQDCSCVTHQGASPAHL